MYVCTALGLKCEKRIFLNFRDRKYEAWNLGVFHYSVIIDRRLLGRKKTGRIVCKNIHYCNFMVVEIRVI